MRESISENAAPSQGFVFQAARRGDGRSSAKHGAALAVRPFHARCSLRRPRALGAAAEAGRAGGAWPTLIRRGARRARSRAGAPKTPKPAVEVKNASGKASLSPDMRFRTLLALFLLLLVGALTGCPSKETIGSNAISVLGPGVVNNPKNKSLRFDILKFGLERFCFEMTRRGAPLKLSDDQPVLGRFYAESCNQTVIDDEYRKSLVVQYSGKGYGWTNVTGRIGFTAAGLVEYAPDFQLADDGSMYIYFRPRKIDSTNFQTQMVESAVARGGMGMLGVNPDQLGLQIVEGQLRRGFTVIRYDDKGETDFGLGYIPKGAKPFKPFVVDSEKVILSNDRTELHTGQQDFIGGFEVKDDDQALYLSASVDGAPAVDAFLIPKGMGDLMIADYVKKPGPVALPSPPSLDEAIPAGQLWKRFVPLPKGNYYLMIDNSAPVGRTVPPAQVGDDRAAKVDYVVQLGDRP
jgi:hypothetical protein